MVSVALTIDLEWCPVPVVDWLLEVLSRAGVEATIFATDTPSVDLGSHEVALHPNPFRAGSKGFLPEAERLKEIHPQAIGLRMHRLAWESSLEFSLAGIGIRYVSTHLIPNQRVEPFRLTPSLVHFPIFYMDHHELLNPGQFCPSFSLDALVNMRVDGLYVFDFHPNMLFTNAPSEEFYRSRVHPVYQDPESLRSIRNPGRGCFDLVTELLALRGRHGYRFLTLSQSLAEFSDCPGHELPGGGT